MKSHPQFSQFVVFLSCRILGFHHGQRRLFGIGSCVSGSYPTKLFSKGGSNIMISCVCLKHTQEIIILLPPLQKIIEFADHQAQLIVGRRQSTNSLPGTTESPPAYPPRARATRRRPTLLFFFSGKSFLLASRIRYSSRCSREKKSEFEQHTHNFLNSLSSCRVGCWVFIMVSGDRLALGHASPNDIQLQIVTRRAPSVTHRAPHDGGASCPPRRCCRSAARRRASRRWASSWRWASSANRR